MLEAWYLIRAMVTYVSNQSNYAFQNRKIIVKTEIE